MATLTNPSEIARETLKQLMSRRMAPSPDNYRAIYNEIAGIADKDDAAQLTASSSTAARVAERNAGPATAWRASLTSR
jgi:hypothetical protein